MDLFIVRHAIAEEHDLDRWPGDRDRPLTDDGVQRFRQTARALARIVDPPQLVLTSPFTRALQTAELLASDAGWPSPEQTGELEPGAKPSAVIDLIATRDELDRVVVVGHEPDLGLLVSTLLAGDGHGFVAMKKGGVARVTIDGRLAAGAGSLRWLLTPRVVEALAAG